MKKFFHKKATTNSCPVKLPVIPEADITVDRIMDMLNEDLPIYGWYTLAKPSVYVFESLTGNSIEGLMMFRREGEFLSTYVMHIVDDAIVFRLYEVAKMAKENVEDLIKKRLSTAATVLYDDSGITDYQQIVNNDVTDDMIREALKDRKSWFIGDKHFQKTP